jgi:uncharacterized protein (DUF697 family)
LTKNSSPHGVADWQVVPHSAAEVADVVQHCRRLVNKRALIAAGVAVVPIPGVDWVTDVATLLKVLPEINRAFGLTPAQIERLAPERRVVVYKTISAAGGMLVGRLVTQELVIKLLKLVSVRLTAQQVAKFVPIAGQAVSAVLTFSSLKYVCEQHIQQCVAVSEKLMLIGDSRAPFQN